MAKFRVTGPDGGTYEVEAPAGATDADVFQMVQQYAKPKREPVGGLKAGAEGVAQGLTFNFADEIEGAGRAAYAKLKGDARPFSDVYADQVKIPRERIAHAKETNPVAFHGAEIGSSLVVPGGLARVGIRGPVAAASGAGLRARSAAGLKEGIAYGAAYGAGSGEGLEDSLNKAATGGLIGGALGSAAPGLIDAGSAVGSRLTGAARAALRPTEHGGVKFAEAVQRDAALPGAAHASPRELQRFSERFDSLVEGSPRSVLADAGGKNVRGLVDVARMQSSSGAAHWDRMLDARAGTQHIRLGDAIEDAVLPRAGTAARTQLDEIGGRIGLSRADGAGARNYYHVLDDLAERFATIGEQRIAPALQRETPMTRQLAAFLDHQDIRPIMQRIMSRQSLEGGAVGLETRTHMLHRLKVEIDNLIDDAERAVHAGIDRTARTDFRTFTLAKRRLLSLIDNPEYKTALREGANVAQLRRAAEAGARHFDRSTPDQIQRRMAHFDTDAERNFFRLGAAQHVVERVRTPNAMRDKTDGLFGSPMMQDKLRVISQDRDAFRTLQTRLLAEARASDTRKITQGNSKTAERLTQADEAMQPARSISAAANAATGRFEPLLNLMSRKVATLNGMTPAVSNAVMEIARSRDPRVMQGIYEQALRQAREVPAERAALARQLIMGSSAASTGNERR